MIKQNLKELQTIPGIGKAMAENLYNLGYRRVSDLKNEAPNKMYYYLCKLDGFRLDPCVMYTFKCAVYFATESQHDPELLKWWNWKDK